MKKLLLLTMVAIMATACHEVSIEQTDGQKGLKMHLSASGTVNGASADGNAAGLTINTPALSEFSLSIKGNGYDRTWSSVSDFSEEERFVAGMYTVAIEYGDITEEGLDKPYFFASKEVEVLDRNRTSEVTLTATVGNAIVEIAMSDEFKSYFVQHDFTLTTSAGNTFTLEENPAQHLFVAPQQTVKIDCTCLRQANVASGLTEKLATQQFEVAPQTRHIVKYDLSKAGSITINVSLNDTVIDTITLPIELNENA